MAKPLTSTCLRQCVGDGSLSSIYIRDTEGWKLPNRTHRIQARPAHRPVIGLTCWNEGVP